MRIFSANGRLLRTIMGTISGPLPNGVTVASADLNGDNFDDVAIGAGRGASPRVVVLDGYLLLDRSRPIRRVFSFLAAGGPDPESISPPVTTTREPVPGCWRT